MKNEKTARIAAERRAKLHAERAANANHNTWLDKKASLELLELQQQTAESEREKAEAARKKERQTAANFLESEQKKVKSERKKVSGLEFLRSSLEHFCEDKLAEITERHHIEYSKEKRALKDKFEREYLSLHSKLQDKSKDLEKQKHLLHESKVRLWKEVALAQVLKNKVVNEMALID